MVRPGRTARPLIADEEVRVRLTWSAPAVCRATPRCPYCTFQEQHVGKPALPATGEAFLEAFLRIREQLGGPLQLSVCFGEPTDDEETLDVLADLALDNRVDVVTNLTAPLEVWARFPATGNVRLCTSWHPQLYGCIGDFLDRRDNVAKLGIQPCAVNIVAFPPYVPMLREWQEACMERGATVVVIDFLGQWRGRQYPGAYGQAEREIIRELGREQFGEQVRWDDESPRGRLCRAGKDYGFILHDGTVRRCYGSGVSLGNVLSGDFRLLDEATPCEAERCGCTDLWQYIVGEDMR